MKYITKLKLAAIHLVCDEEDRSTEYMIQYMQDMCKVDHDCVMNYLAISEDDKDILFAELLDFYSMFENKEI